MNMYIYGDNKSTIVASLARSVWAYCVRMPIISRVPVILQTAWLAANQSIERCQEGPCGEEPTLALTWSLWRGTDISVDLIPVERNRY
jgi:hypothetical protein